MNRMLPFVLAGFGIALLSPLRAEEVSETAETLAGKIRSEIGAGWNVSYHKGTGLLEVESAKAVRISSFLPSSGPAISSRSATLQKFSFTLRVFPLVSPEEYSERAKRNAALKLKLTELYADLRRKGIAYEDRGGEFRPHTEAEKRDVAECRRLESSFEELPDFFFEEISLMWIAGSEDAALDVADPATQRECDTAIRKTLALLSKYPGGGSLIRLRPFAR